MAQTYPDSLSASHRPQATNGETPATERLWSWRTVVAFVLIAVGIGLYIAFGSEQADSEYAGELVPAGIRAGTITGTVSFLLGVVALFVEAAWRGWKERRIGMRMAAALGIGLLAIFTGFLLMFIVVHIAFG